MSIRSEGGVAPPALEQGLNEKQIQCVVLGHQNPDAAQICNFLVGLVHLCGHLPCRNMKQECAALSQRAFYGDIASMQLTQFLDNGQAKTRPTVFNFAVGSLLKTAKNVSYI